jgi:ArsR family transcriptional regulator
VPEPDDGRLLDIGTGTGRVLELLAPRVREALGVDASKAMLALARARLSGLDFAHCAVRLADMYRLPLSDQSFDTVVLQMVLHHAEDPAGAVLEATRVLSRGGQLLVIDLGEHDHADVTGKLAHRWPGFSDQTMNEIFTSAGIAPREPLTIAGPLPIRIWPATRTAAATAGSTLERAH